MQKAIAFNVGFGWRLVLATLRGQGVGVDQVVRCTK